MKKLISSAFVLLFVTSSLNLFSQVAINTTGTNAHASSMLDVSADNKGILVPRLTTVQRDNISTPETGLLIFQTDNTPGFYFYNGSSWVTVGSEAISLNDLSDAVANSESLFIGNNAGTNTNIWYSGGVGIGYNALKSNTTGEYLCAVGRQALSSNTTGKDNTAIGDLALHSNTIGFNNTTVGSYASYENNSGHNNIAIGFMANINNETGSYNTIIGSNAGSNFVNRSGCVFIGYEAGKNDYGSNRLYIENSSSSSPLIYGEFDNNFVKINGNLEVTGSFNISINDLSDGKTGGRSVFLGEGAGIADDGTEHNNVALGYNALQANTTGGNNVSLGAYTNGGNITGSGNTIIGFAAGSGAAQNRSGCVFLGNYAGYGQPGDNKLFIENSTSSSPLIYGEFDSDLVKINGTLNINNVY